MMNEKLQKVLTVLGIVLAIYLGVQAYNGFLEGKYMDRKLPTTKTISVSASGDVFVKPDVAQTSVTVYKKAATVGEAQKAHTAAINKVVNFIKSSGVEEKDIKTTGYTIYPEYDYLRDRGNVFKGYIVRQTLEIKVRNLEKVGEILAGATQNGANEVGGISFIVDDEDAAKAEARKEAIEKAKSKAEGLAKDLGVSLGRVVNFSESGDQPRYYATIKAPEGMGGSDISVPPEIPTGENEIVVSVTLTYEIK